MTKFDFLTQLHASIETNAERVAFVFGNDEVSYAELGRSIESIRQTLEPLIEEGAQCVAVYATQERMTYASVLAVMSLGLAYVPLNPKAPLERNSSVLSQSGAQILLSARRNEDVVALSRSAATKITTIETAALSGSVGLSRPSIPAPSQLAYLLFTSGSTGVPKGVPITHDSLNAFLSTVLYQTDWSFSGSNTFSKCSTLLLISQLCPTQFRFVLAELVWSFQNPVQALLEYRKRFGAGQLRWR